MSLQVWLPLNGNLDNLGLRGDVLATATGATVAAAGKIGKCYQFGTAASQYIDISKEAMTLLTTEASVCFWLKILTWNTNYATFFQAGAAGMAWKHYTFGLLRNNTASTCCFTISNGSSASNASYLTPALDLNKWYHITLIYKTGHCLIYINGQLYQDYTTSIVPNFANISRITLGMANSRASYQTNCQMNDFRVYSHALSTKEIKEISKGLILHYKLDNNGLGGKNLALNTHNLNIKSSQTNLNMYNRGSSTRQLRTDGFYEVKGTAAWQGLSFYANQLNLTPGTKITYSFYIYGNGNPRAFSFYPMMFNSSGTRDTSTKLPISIDGGTYTTVNSKTFGSTTATSPEYHYVTFEWNQAVANIISDGGKIELSIQAHGTWNSGDWFCMFAPKVEIGDKPTPWSPAPSEVDAENIIYDSSGYEHHGTPVGTITTTIPSPRYSVATNFAASSAINCGRGGMVTDSITVNVWTKYSSYFNLVSCTEGGGWNFENNNGNGLTFPIYISGVGYVHIDSASRPAVANYANEWHMFTGVYDRIGQQTRLYIDGELIGTGAVSSPNPIHYHASNVIWLNAEATGSNTTGLYGNAKQMSDFRIYATALKDQDILQLYHTSALVDKNNNFYTYQYNQQGNGNEIEYFHSFRSCYAGAIAEMKEDGFHIEGYDWIDHGNGVFIPVNPINKIYKFDIICSISAGNQFYIGWERYDQNKATGTNSATIYAISPKPTEDLVYQRYQGTINLSANGLNNPCAFIKLRILNKWSGSTTNTEGKAIIHYLSLKEYDSNKTITPIKIEKEGIVTTNSFIENSIGTSIDRSQILHSNSFYEI